MNSRQYLALLGLLTLAGLVAGVAQEKQLTAREMFYAAPAAAKPPGKETPAAKAQPPEKVAQSKPKPKPPETVAESKPKPKPPETVAQSKPPASHRIEPATGPTRAGSKIIPVAYTQRVPLGVRYSLLKKTDGGPGVEVDAGGVFRAGDRIRLSVEVNDTAYLYLVNRGSSGAWKVLFPSAEIEGGSNLVERGRRYEIPAGYVFTFDEQPGVEKLFLVLSRQPEPDLENLIYSLSQRPGPAGTPTGPPAAAPAPETGPGKIMLAQNIMPIGDGLVDRLRTSYARDLIIEKVDESAPGPKKEHAVYVVNTTGRDDSRVVVDIALNHQ